MMGHKTESAKVTIYLVGHGYQIDIEDDQDNVLETCRDYAGNINVAAGVKAIQQFIHTLDKVPGVEEDPEIGEDE